MSTKSLSQRPSSAEYFEYYHTYIRLVPDGNIQETASTQLERVSRLLANLSENVPQVVHAPYTWTLRQVFGHIIDAERIFADRLHRISSGDPQPQLGMDQDLYVNGQDFSSPTLAALVEEWQFPRCANLLLNITWPSSASGSH